MSCPLCVSKRSNGQYDRHCSVYITTDTIAVIFRHAEAAVYRACPETAPKGLLPTHKVCSYVQAAGVRVCELRFGQKRTRRITSTSRRRTDGVRPAAQSARRSDGTVRDRPLRPFSRSRGPDINESGSRTCNKVFVAGDFNFFTLPTVDSIFGYNFAFDRARIFFFNWLETIVICFRIVQIKLTLQRLNFFFFLPLVTIDCRGFPECKIYDFKFLSSITSEKIAVTIGVSDRYINT